MKQYNFLKSLSILHLAFFAGQAILFAIMYATRDANQLVDDDTLRIYKIVWGALGIVVILVGSLIYRKQVTALSNNEGLSATEKIQGYRGANILRWASVEGISLFSIIFYFLTGYPNFFYVGLALLAMFFFLKPSLSKTLLELKLTERDIEGL